MSFSVVKLVLLALVAVLLAVPSSSMDSTDHWYFKHPTPDDQQHQEYKQLYAEIFNRLGLGGRDRNSPTTFKAVSFDNQAADPFLFKDRIVETPHRDLDYYARQVAELVPEVRRELNGPFHPRHIKKQLYGSIDQRFMYYHHITEIAKAYDAELRIFESYGVHPTVLQNVHVIKEAYRLADMAQKWHELAPL